MKVLMRSVMIDKDIPNAICVGEDGVMSVLAASRRA